ncbi:hypothetical protein Hte_004902 [Hypoxylon texense]
MDAIPDELYLGILDTLDRKADLDTLLALRQVNRRWNRIVIPYIYFTFKLSAFCRSYRGDCLDAPDCYSHYFSYLGRKIDELYTYSGYVKELELSYEEVEKLGPTNGRVPYGELPSTVDIGQFLAEAAPRLPPHLRESFAKEFYPQGPAYINKLDGFFALALLVCPKLKKVSMSTTHFGGKTMQVLQMAARPWLESFPREQGHILDSMEHLEIGRRGWSVSLHIHDVIDILALPKLKHIHLVSLQDRRKDVKKRPWKPRDPRLRHLEPIDITLEDCNLSEDGLERILAACSKPRSLFITAKYKPAFSRLTNIIAKRKGFGEGLEFLFISSDLTWEEEMANLVSTLRVLDGSLRSLVIAYKNIPSIDAFVPALPRSLREVLILDATLSPLFPDNELFQSVGSDATPNLERVAISTLDSEFEGAEIVQSCLTDRRVPDTEKLREFGCTVYVKNEPPPPLMA